MARGVEHLRLESTDPIGFVVGKQMIELGTVGCDLPFDIVDAAEYFLHDLNLLAYGELAT
jgi:hypothetical protein